MLIGKKSDSLRLPNKERVIYLKGELAYHEAAAERLEQQGNVNTYHHERAAQIRAELNLEEVRDELD